MFMVPSQNFTRNLGLDARCILVILTVIEHAEDGQGRREVVLIKTVTA